jgi:predicted ribonuclease YlaK
VAPDTSFFIEHEDKLEEANFQSLLDLPGMPVHVLVPIVVVDELDGLKKSKDRDTRWRAAYTLAVLDRVLAASGGEATFGTVIPAGQEGSCTVEILFDPAGHVRLPISDDELIDRILAIQPLAGRQVTLLTYDTGQSTRARAAGLPVKS